MYVRIYIFDIYIYFLNNIFLLLYNRTDTDITGKSQKQSSESNIYHKLYQSAELCAICTSSSQLDCGNIILE